MSDRTHTSRLSMYKNAGVGVNELRRKRAEVSVSLRKLARSEQFLKRRAIPSGAREVEEPGGMTPSEIVQGLNSPDLAVKTASARATRRIITQEQDPQISVMVNYGVVKPLVECLDLGFWDKCQDLLYEAAWALTNIAAGTHEHTMAIIYAGAVPKLVSLLGRGGKVGEQCAWALGNIAGDGEMPRDFVLSYGALPALLPLMTPNTAPSQLRIAAWTYSNFCRNKNPLVNFEQVAPALPFVSDLLTISDQDVLVDTCWAISFLTDGPIERIEEVQNTKHLLPRLIKLLQHESEDVRTPALRTIGNMFTGSNIQTDRCLDAGCLDHLATLLQCRMPSLVREAAWAVSNILAGTQQQVQKVIDKGLVSLLIDLLHCDDVKCQKEAAWAITNVCLAIKPSQHEALIATEFLGPYCAIMASPEQNAVASVLDGLTHLLQVAENSGEAEQLCLKLEEIGALDKIEWLQEHKNENIYKKAFNILDKYFNDQDDKNTQLQESTNVYQFGATESKGNINF